MNANDKAFLGIDVGKSKLDCALLLPGGSRLDKFALNSPQGPEAAGGWLACQGGACAHVCPEATHIYWGQAAQFLAERGHTAGVVNPAQIKAHANARLSRGKTGKTGKGDAGPVADFCAKHNPSRPGSPPPNPNRPCAGASGPTSTG